MFDDGVGFYSRCDCYSGYAHIDVFRSALSNLEVVTNGGCVPKLTLDLGIDYTSNYCFDCATSIAMWCPGIHTFAFVWVIGRLTL